MSGLRLLKTINFPLKQPPWMDEVVYAGVENNIATIDHMVAKSIEQAQAVRESKKFTAEGQRDELARIAAEVDEALLAFKPQTGYQAHVAQAEKAMQPSPTARTDASLIREELQRQEIRQYAATMKDRIDLDTYYRQAVNNGNDLIADALENDPTGRLRFANPDIVKELRFERQSRKYPEAAATWRTYSHALTELKSAMGFARTALREAGLSSPSLDPLHNANSPT